MPCGVGSERRGRFRRGNHRRRRGPARPQVKAAAAAQQRAARQPQPGAQMSEHSEQQVQPKDAKAHNCRDQPEFAHAIDIIRPPKSRSIGDRDAQAAMLSSQNRPQGSRMAKLKEVFVCQNCGIASPKWQGQCTGCGEWNTLAGRNPGSAAGAAPRRGRASGGPSRPVVAGRRSHRRSAASDHRFGRTRSGARRRPGPRLGDLDRRRSRDRQVHADAAGGRGAQPSGPGALCDRRGIAQAGRIARRAGWACKPRPLG